MIVKVTKVATFLYATLITLCSITPLITHDYAGLNEVFVYTAIMLFIPMVLVVCCAISDEVDLIDFSEAFEKEYIIHRLLFAAAIMFEIFVCLVIHDGFLYNDTYCEGTAIGWTGAAAFCLLFYALCIWIVKTSYTSDMRDLKGNIWYPIDGEYGKIVKIAEAGYDCYWNTIRNYREECEKKRKAK